MLFNSFSFLIFYAVVFGLFWLLPQWSQKKWLLLIASQLFYAAWNPPYVLLLMFSTAADWYLARRIGRSEDPRQRRTLLIVSLACNLLLLSYFKYGDFVLDNFVRGAALLGFAYHPAKLGILLPIGISFYTFASLSYTIDVYRKEVRSDYSFRDYALFVSFFPHLVAGPIVRASVLLPQIERPTTPTADQIGWGWTLVCLGLFAKVVLADALFAPVVNEVYAHPEAASFFETWSGVLAFSGQIYYDFCGYSMCAIGLALSFGFRFPENFDSPYGALSFSDFWRRWHISLSSWLRDYLYIPLGGNRHGQARTYLALCLTMLIGGLWHGASWMFVLWGGLHGLYLALERALQGKLPSLQLSPGFKRWLIFLLITLAWVPFRANNLSQMRTIVDGLLARHTAVEYLDMPNLLALTGITLTFFCHGTMRMRTLASLFAQRKATTAYALSGVLAICLIAMFLFSSGNQNAFIYFQF
jgi:D-alanyl-lipoteichoic acid acyltransferase DltB (MBOAT superfamily)